MNWILGRSPRRRGCGEDAVVEPVETTEEEPAAPAEATPAEEPAPTEENPAAPAEDDFFINKNVLPDDPDIPDLSNLDEMIKQAGL